MNHKMITYVPFRLILLAIMLAVSCSQLTRANELFSFTVDVPEANYIIEFAEMQDGNCDSTAHFAFGFKKKNYLTNNYRGFAEISISAYTKDPKFTDVNEAAFDVKNQYIASELTKYADIYRSRVCDEAVYFVLLHAGYSPPDGIEYGLLKSDEVVYLNFVYFGDSTYGPYPYSSIRSASKSLTYQQLVDSSIEVYNVPVNSKVLEQYWRAIASSSTPRLSELNTVDTGAYSNAITTIVKNMMSGSCDIRSVRYCQYDYINSDPNAWLCDGAPLHMLDGLLCFGKTGWCQNKTGKVFKSQNDAIANMCRK